MVSSTVRGRAAFVRLASRPIPRVTRMMRAAAELDLAPTYIGAMRADGLERRDVWDGFDVRRVGPRLPLLNGKHFGKYVVGVLRFNIAAIREYCRSRPQLIHASDVETAVGAVLYGRLTHTPVLFNIHDNLADRYVLPSPARRVLNSIEGVIVLASSLSLVPEDFRRAALPEWCQHKVSVVRNSPADLGWAEPEFAHGGRVRLLYAGWLDWGRGIAGLLELAQRHPWIEVQVAGEGNPDVIAAVRESPATYLGFLGHEEVMRRTAATDLVVALYDPSRPINRAAAPNKLAEAFSAGRPVIINTEVIVAQSPAFQQCTVRLPYGEFDQLGTLLREFYDEPDRLRYGQMCSRARELYDREYSWEMVLSQMKDALCSIVAFAPHESREEDGDSVG